MKNITKIIILFLSITAFVGCSSDSDSDSVAEVTLASVVLTTKVPALTNNNLAILSGGKLSSSFTGSENFYTGICYSNVPNPTVLNQQIGAGSSSNLDFSCSIENITLGGTYYIKAFVQNGDTGEIKYGNEVSIVIPVSLTTGIVKNISCSGFSVDVNIANSLSGNDERGICFSTSQNPTIENEKIPDVTFGSGTFNITLTNPVVRYFVSPGTTYYLKSFVKINNRYYYGNQVSFKTAGYIGGSGGYVFFDKGEITNGWRYLEAATSELIYNNDVNWLFNWNNCNSTTFLPGLSNDIGTGAENTTIIRNNCNFTRNAATMARFTSLNGKSDWFLPSIEELKLLYTLKEESVISYNSNVYPLISSSQQSNSTNWGVDFSNGNSVGMYKTSAGRVWQVRRF